VVVYGKRGSTGVTLVKSYATPGAAQKAVDKLVRDKKKKGYCDAVGEFFGGDLGVGTLSRHTCVYFTNNTRRSNRCCYVENTA